MTPNVPNMLNMMGPRLDPVIVCDLHGCIVEANEAVSDLFGFPTEDVIGQSLSRFLPQRELQRLLGALLKVAESGMIRHVPFNIRNVFGDIIPITLNASALRDHSRNVIGVIGVLKDMRPDQSQNGSTEPIAATLPAGIAVDRDSASSA